MFQPERTSFAEDVSNRLYDIAHCQVNNIQQKIGEDHPASVDLFFSALKLRMGDNYI